MKMIYNKIKRLISNKKNFEASLNLLLKEESQLRKEAFLLSKAFKGDKENYDLLLKAEGETEDFYTKVWTLFENTLTIFTQEIQALNEKMSECANKQDIILSIFPELETNKKIASIEEEGFKYLDYFSDTLGRSRETMPQIKNEDLVLVLSHFTKIKVGWSELTIPIKDIKCPQSELNPNFILEKFKKQDFKPFYIISKDNYLVDGSHSWAAQIQVNPDQEVKVYQIDLDIASLLRRLNLLKISQNKNVLGDEIKKSISEVDSFLDNYFGGGPQVERLYKKDGLIYIKIKDEYQNELEDLLFALKVRFSDYKKISIEGDLVCIETSENLQKSLEVLLSALEGGFVGNVAFLNIENILINKYFNDRGKKTQRYNQFLDGGAIDNSQFHSIVDNFFNGNIKPYVQKPKYS